MATEQKYKREPNGNRLDIAGGMNTVASADLIPQGKYSFLQNVRRYLQGRTVARAPMGSNVLTGTLPTPGATSMLRLNDTTPDGPVSGFALIIGAATKMFLNATQILTGLSGLPLSFITFRPNASPQPWAYIGDPTGMWKVRSDGTIWKDGIAEPQSAPSVTFVGGGSGTTQIFYRYVYRSSVTGALSNPSPESIPGTNSQFAPTATVNATDFATKITFNATQYEFSTPQLRTKGGVAPGTVTDYVIFHNFGLAIPAGVNIDGIQVDLNWVGQNAGCGVLSGVSLYYLGAPLGNAKFPGVANQSFTTDTLQGGNADTWDATLTPDIANDNSFGFGVQITTQAVGGSDRSFIDFGTITVFYSVQNAQLTPAPSSDPQVDKIDFYREGGLLSSFTYVGTGPNTATLFTDILADLAAVNNPQLEFDNYEPFPGIDLPKAGTVNVAAGAVTGTMDVAWVSGDTFNVKWLPGTDIIIGGVAYIFYNRPSSTTALTVILDTPLPSPATGLTYEIPEPDLAAVPSPVIWGPTPDNGGSFFFGLDPLNKGDLLWSKGNNFDSAPQTNRLSITSGSEVLMNGVITSELSTVFSSERFWLLIPNFADALADVTGTEGEQWVPIQSAATRGLYMRYAIAVQGAMIAYRAKDCICLSMGGAAEQSITDDIYNLFPHEGEQPGIIIPGQPVVIGDQTIFPPDDTNPNAQTIAIGIGYIYYDYQDVNGNPRTLVYDIAGKGWIVDVYNPVVNCHLWQVGPNVNGVLCGCIDGTVRAMATGGSEDATAMIMTRSENSGDVRALKRIGDVFIKALVNASKNVVVALWKSRLTTLLTGFSPTSLTGTGSLSPYIIDFTDGFGDDVDDIALQVSWPVVSGNILDLWQPDWTELPENTQDRPTDWGDAGGPGAMWVKGLLLEADTFGTNKVIQIENGDDGTFHTPDQSPLNLDGQQKIALSFSTPFVAHTVRIVSTDGVPWRMWSAAWVAEPYAELVDDFVPPFDNLGSNDAKFVQGFLLEADTNNTAKAFTVQLGDDLSFHVPDQSPATFNGKSVKAFTFTPPLIAHSMRFLSADSTPWRRFGFKWITLPFPELVPEWQTQLNSLGGKGWQTIEEINVAYISTTALMLTLTFDPGAVPASITLTVPSSAGVQAKVKIVVPDNKFKLVAFRLSGSAPFRVFVQDFECKIGEWGRQGNCRNGGVIGGQSSPGAEV